MPSSQHTHSLWRIYNRQAKPLPFTYGGNLPYDDPEFGKRMLALHLDESEPAGSRVSAERTLQIDWLINTLNLQPNDHIFDITCGPGLYAVALATRNLRVSGVDFAQTSIDYANDLANSLDLTSRCSFELADVRTMNPPQNRYDAAILLYGQLAVMTQNEARTVLKAIANSLKSGGHLVLEMLNPANVDKNNSSWWFTDDEGLWGDLPYLHLGERIWYPDDMISAERYHILNLESGIMDEIILCDQVYSAETLTEMLKAAGFSRVSLHPAWDNIGLYDQDEWLVYIATK